MSSNERFKNGALSGIITKSGKSLPVSTFRSEDLDSMLKNGVSLKDSPTTTAALVRFPGSDTEYFLKRNNNKGFRFTCRYLFRKARVFHAAEMAEVFENLKIRTPKAYMAAEKKTGLYLHAGYILTEKITATPIDKLLLNAEDNEAFLKTFLRWAAKTITTLHRAGIVHGDLKLINFYCDGDWKDPDNSFGIWDLDSVRIRKKAIPGEVDREISRIFFTLAYYFNELNDCDKIKERCREFCALYHEVAPDLYPPSLDNVMCYIRKRLKRWNRQINKGNR